MLLRAPDAPLAVRISLSLRVVGLSVAPANAHPWIAEVVHWRTRARAGEGAVREVCDVLLAAQGHVPAILAGAAHSRDGSRA